MDADVSEEDICAAHELKKGPKDTVPPLVIRFTYTSVKQDVMSARRNLRRIQGATNPVYFNDQLTEVNGSVFGKARQLQKQGIIAGT